MKTLAASVHPTPISSNIYSKPLVGAHRSRGTRQCSTSCIFVALKREKLKSGEASERSVLAVVPLECLREQAEAGSHMRSIFTVRGELLASGLNELSVLLAFLRQSASDQRGGGTQTRPRRIRSDAKLRRKFHQEHRYIMYLIICCGSMSQYLLSYFSNVKTGVITLLLLIRCACSFVTGPQR